MQTSNFYIVKTNGQDVIRDHKTLLQIKIYNLDNQSIVVNDNEVILYGIGRDNLLLFETVNFHNCDASLVAYALAWYVDYIDHPEMIITMDDPRTTYRLKIA